MNTCGCARKGFEFCGCPARAAIAQQPATCRTCRGEGIDGEPGDTPGTGYTWACEDRNAATRRAIVRAAAAIAQEPPCPKT